ncbi:hypothetical protein LC593_32900 [Nostoc sp. CHAB 5844]|nr:hypothetical protein [Nostoc sp. CHAB 5844]
MYSGGNYYQGDTLLEGQWLALSSLFDAISNYTNAIKWSCESLINRSNPLQIYFGNGARQDSNYLYIKKSDLTGLTPLVNNSAESLLIALLLKNLDMTNDVDDLITLTLFDTYVSENKIKNIILIQPSYLALTTNDELQDLPTSINPMNYD